MAKETVKKIPEGCRLRPDGITLEKRFVMNGKRYSVYGKNKKEIEENVQKKKNEIAQGITGENILLDTYFERWCERRVNNPDIKPATIYTDRRRYKKIAPILGKRKIRSIKKDDVYDLLNKLHKNGLSSKGIKDELSLLNTIMNDAADVTEVIIKNPCKGVKPPKRTEEEKQVLAQKHRFLSSSEINTFFKYAAKSVYCNMFSFMILSGVRCGEACALSWNDIDEKTGIIHIIKTVTRIDDHHFER